jgi:hypothetical protein
MSWMKSFGYRRTEAYLQHPINPRPDSLSRPKTNVLIVDVVLHLGDQVYAWKEFQDAQAVLRYSGYPRGTESVTSTEAEIKRLQKTIKDRLRDIYR